MRLIFNNNNKEKFALPVLFNIIITKDFAAFEIFGYEVELDYNRVC